MEDSYQNALAALEKVKTESEEERSSKYTKVVQGNKGFINLINKSRDAINEVQAILATLVGTYLCF